MITTDEIEAKSKEFDVHTSDVQRDYVYGWILAGIFTVSPLKGVLFLKGGNAFRKGYFERTRFSEDLDFGTEQGIEPDRLIRELNAVCDFAQAQSGVVFEKERNRIEEKFSADSDLKVYHVRLYFKDFYGNAQHIVISVRMDVTLFEKLYAPLQARQLIHPYSDGPACRAPIQCMKLEELLATKIKCLLQRQHSFDLFDFVYSIFVNNELAVDKRQIVEIFLKRTIFGPSPGVVKGLLLGLPLEVFRRFWDGFLVCPQQTRFGFDKALGWFQQVVNDLFGSFPVTRYGEVAYFAPETRNAILEAGRTQTLLRLRYHGITREIEPYSIKYKKRKDRHAREYLYAWDRTGGQSGVGIKAFLPNGVESIEATEIKFEPRYDIEVAKAGEPTGKGYFDRPFGGGRRGLARGSRGGGSLPGYVYVIECSYCNKTFERKVYNTRLNPHRDRYGNECYGRTGIIVDQEYRS